MSDETLIFEEHRRRRAWDADRVSCVKCRNRAKTPSAYCPE
jgi:hypothetical protein